MKQIIFIIAIAAAGALVLPASADTGHQPPPVVLGIGITSDSRLVPEVKPDRYSFSLEAKQQVSISSTHFPGDASNYVTLEATLRDASGNVVATASDDQGHFEIEEALPEGDYTLEVNGVSLKSQSENASRYEIHITTAN